MRESLPQRRKYGRLQKKRNGGIVFSRKCNPQKHGQETREKKGDKSEGFKLSRTEKGNLSVSVSEMEEGTKSGTKQGELLN